jgi:hypothetical protein
MREVMREDGHYLNVQYVCDMNMKFFWCRYKMARVSERQNNMVYV